MEHEEEKKLRAMTTNLLTPPPPGLAAVKDSMFIGRGGRGGRGKEEKEEEADKRMKKKNREKSHSPSTKKQSCYFSKIVQVPLSALVEKFCVSRLQDFKKNYDSQ